MLVMSSPIFVVDTKMIFGFNFREIILWIDQNIKENSNGIMCFARYLFSSIHLSTAKTSFSTKGFVKYTSNIKKKISNEKTFLLMKKENVYIKRSVHLLNGHGKFSRLIVTANSHGK